MCRLKLSRLFCLLFALSVFFASFGLSASAASDSENLIDSDLTNWTSYYLGYTEIYRSKDAYYIMSRPEILSDTDTRVKASCIYDLADLTAGHSYTFNFHLLSYDEIKADYNPSIPSTGIYDGLINGNGYYVIGLGSYNSSNDVLAFNEDCSVSIDKNNYLDYFGKDTKITFELPNIVNPCIFISYYEASTRNSIQYTYLKNISLVDNEQAKEDGFFDRLFQFFHDLKWEIVGGSCGDGCSKSPHTSLAEKITTKFQEGFDNLKQFFHDLKWDVTGGICDKEDCPKKEHTSLAGRINSHVDSFKNSFDDKITKLKQSVIDLKDGLINGIKSLFIPDEAFITTWKEELEFLLQDRLGIIWDAGDFFISLIQSIGDLLTTTADDIHYELPEMEIELNGETYMLWQAQQVDFSFLKKNSFFSMLYKLYKAVLNVFLGIPLLNYAKKEMDATLHN